MLTIIATTRPFLGKFKLIQENAIASWANLGRDVNIVLVGDEIGVSKIAKKYGAKLVKKVSRNPSGLPYLDSLLFLGQKNSKDDLVAYLNSDIILFKDFVETAKQVSKEKKKFLIIGRRFDLEVNKKIDFSNKKSVKALMRLLNTNGKLHDYTGVDYFIFPKGFWHKIPKFSIGRTTLDHWLVNEALRISNCVIDATGLITIIHQNHEYTAPDARNGVEAIRNLKLANGKLSDLRSANFVISQDFKIKQRSSLFVIKRKWIDIRNNLNNLLNLRIGSHLH